MSDPTPTMEPAAGRGMEQWPMEVRALVASLQVQSTFIETDRRRRERRPYTVQGVLWFEDALSKMRRSPVYTRDISDRMMAFVTGEFLKSGQSVILDLPGKAGAVQRVHGSVRRFRQLSGGWFDCVVELEQGIKVVS